MEDHPGNPSSDRTIALPALPGVALAPTTAIDFGQKKRPKRPHSSSGTDDFRPRVEVMAVVALVLVVVEQQLVAEVGSIVTPHRVDVVAVVDRVVELDEDVGALDAVVVRRPALLATRPAEPELLEAIGS